MPVPTSPETSNLEFVKIGVQSLGYIGGWALVVWGWTVNHSQNRSRDVRKELRDRVNEIANIVRDVEADVVSYLTGEEGQSRSASFWTVQFGAKRVNASVVMSRTFNTSEIEAALISYRQAITGQALEGPNSQPKSPTARDRDMRQVSKCGNSLVRVLESRYAELYDQQPKRGKK